ncbi:MAG: flagellar filament capping protein FliD [Armatimonadetes bacterium]|nr:flagellar filament capping protein FliD [Armatimonadota bacterium]
MSTTPPISFSGLASGLDTSSIISSLVQAEQQPITQVQQQESTYNDALSAWQSLNSNLSQLQSAASSLSQAATFTAATAASSDSSVASITALPGAQIGNHTLTVTQVAQSQKVVTKSITSGSTALGETGSFTLNGKTITVGATDALTDVAVKINASGAGVTATVVHVGQNDYRMTLTGNQSGTANALSAADNGSGTVLSDLGLISGAAAIRQVVTPDAGHTGAGSLGLNSATQSVANTLGIASGSAASGTIQINGVGVAVNLNTDSLNTIAASINKAGIAGITAEVVALPDPSGNISGSSPQQLQILSSGTAPQFTDSNNILQTLGVTQSGFTGTISQAQDAKFSLDGLNMTRSSNIVSDAIPGATLTLLSGTPSSPGTATLSVTQDTNSIVQSVQSFATAYNAIQDFITQQNTFTAPAGNAAGQAGTSPPLFGDSTLSQIQQQLGNTLNAVAGATTLESIGLTLNSSGDLSVNASTLTSALQTNPTQVASLFGLSGQADNPGVQFVTGSIKTQASSGPGYAINITQAATQSSALAQAAQSGTSTAPETLTFNGALFNNSATSITLPAGNALQDTVNQINASSSLNGKIYASIDPATHALKLASLSYGSGTGFTVTSDQTSGGSGIAAGTTATAGVDVQGTINGEAATGQGRTLTGNAGNSTTEGIQLLVSATSAGAYGHVQVTHGVADALGNALTQIMDPISGGVILAENSLNTQISNAQQQIQNIQDQVSAYQDYLTQMFSDMETRVAQLQSQGAAFAAQIGTSTSTSSTSSIGGSLSSSSKA